MTEKCSFHNPHGERLSALLERSESSPDSIVIVSPNYAYRKEGRLMREVIDELCARGVPSFTLDYSGCGNSEGNFSRKTITDFTKDLEAAVDFVNGLGYTSVHLFGASGGATISMAYALTHPGEVRSMALKSPVWNYFEQRLHRYGREFMDQWKIEGIARLYNGKVPVEYTFIEDVLQNWDLSRRASEIACPTLILHGTEDEEVPVAASRESYRKIPHSVYVEINGADHNLHIGGERTCSGGLIAGWLKDQIRDQHKDV